MLHVHYNILGRSACGLQYPKLVSLPCCLSISSCIRLLVVRNTAFAAPTHRRASAQWESHRNGALHASCARNNAFGVFTKWPCANFPLRHRCNRLSIAHMEHPVGWLRDCIEGDEDHQLYLSNIHPLHISRRPASRIKGRWGSSYQHYEHYHDEVSVKHMMNAVGTFELPFQGNLTGDCCNPSTL